MADRAWEAPAAAGSVIDQWADIAPELVGKVQPVHYDTATGRLDLLPASTAYATQLRLLARQMVTRINAATGSTTVRAIRVLPPGPATGATTPGPAPEASAAAPKAPVKTRQTASPGYHRALNALQATKPNRHANPAIQAAIDRQDQALRARREPETAFTDGQALLEHLHAKTAAEQDARACALRRARMEKKAGVLPEVPRVCGAA
ncbi:hypothetical protein GCM10027168_44000 [Streptomyces capparidis]